MTSVIDYLESKNIKYTLIGQEALITCPACGKEKLSINTNSLVYQCFVCSAENPGSDYASGSLSKLKKLWGDSIDIASVSLPSYIKDKNREEVDFTTIVDRYHFQLLKNKKGIKYLFNRGFDEEDIIKHKLGFVEMKGDLWISMPSFEDGIPKLIKYRKITDDNPETKKMEREFNSKSILFNGDALNDFSDIIVVEGEMDCISLLKQGVENVVSATGGAGTLLPEWYDKLSLMSKITFVFDPDAAGQNSVLNTWVERLGINKCWNILLPDNHDLNSYFLEYTIDDFNEIEPYQFKVNGVVSLHDAFLEMYSLSQSKDKLIYPLPWSEVNELLGGGLELTQLLTIGAPSGIGKTTMALQIAHYFIKIHNIPCLMFCLEMTSVKLAVKFAQLEYDLTYSEVQYDQALIYTNEIGKMPMYFAYTPDIKLDVLYNTIEEARNRYGVKFVIFDNLQLLVTSDKESEYARAMKYFKRIPMSLNLMMCLISQPRKLNADEFNYDSLKGSAAIGQASDHILLVNAKRLKGDNTNSSFDPIRSIINDKARFSAGGRRRLKMVGEKSRFDSL